MTKGIMRNLVLGLAMLPVVIGGNAALASGQPGAMALPWAHSQQRVQFVRPALSGDIAASGQAAPSFVVAQVDTTQQLEALEAEVRKLTGKVEDLNFQILQMQDKMNKMQQDNEYRFLQLEKGDGKKSEATSTHSNDAVAETRPAARSGKDKDRGAPPRSLGTIQFDAKGDVVGSSANPDDARPADAQASEPADKGAKVTALPQTDDPNVLYKQGYDLVLSGDYAAAEATFRAHIKRYPADPHTGDARYWLGEALYGQGRYSEAAQVFLNAHRTYPKARTGAADLLKLGMSLAHMGNRDVACATFKEVGVQYPDASAAIREKVSSEQARNKC